MSPSESLAPTGMQDIVDDTVAEVGDSDTLLMVGGLLGAVVTLTVLET